MSASAKIVIWAYRDRGKEERVLSQRRPRVSSGDVTLVVESSGRIWVSKEPGGMRVYCGSEEQYVSADLVSIVFVHGGSGEIAGSKHLEATPIIDYSSIDEPYYSQMLFEVEAAATEQEFVQVALRWIQFWRFHFRIDPIRRIKHSAMNLFAPLDTDCQYLLEVWGRGDYGAARRHLEELQRDWQGQPPYSNSPLSKLARLWYLLVGDRIGWPYWVGDLAFYGHLLVEKPDKVVNLAKQRATDNQGLCLYDWLVKVGRTESEPWKRSWDGILSEAGLTGQNNQSVPKSFVPYSQAGIYRFAVELQKRVIEGNLPDLRPDTRMQGFDNCDTVEANFKAFHNWMRALNNGFEKLVKEVGGRVSLKVGE